MITKMANKFWVKNGREYLWIKISTIIGVIATLLIIASGGDYNFFGISGTLLYILFGVIFIVALVLYPFKQ